MILQLIPTIPLSKAAFIVLNYAIVGMFVLMNLYITSQIVRAYGPVLWDLFRGERSVNSASSISGLDLDLTPQTRDTLGLVMMVIGGILTVSIIGMIYGIPLFMIGWDLRNPTSGERSTAAAS